MIMSMIMTMMMMMMMMMMIILLYTYIYIYIHLYIHTCISHPGVLLLKTARTPLPSSPVPSSFGGLEYYTKYRRNRNPVPRGLDGI